MRVSAQSSADASLTRLYQYQIAITCAVNRVTHAVSPSVFGNSGSVNSSSGDGAIGKQNLAQQQEDRYYNLYFSIYSNSNSNSVRTSTSSRSDSPRGVHPFERRNPLLPVDPLSRMVEDTNTLIKSGPVLLPVPPALPPVPVPAPPSSFNFPLDSLVYVKVGRAIEDNNYKRESRATVSDENDIHLVIDKCIAYSESDDASNSKLMTLIVNSCAADSSVQFVPSQSTSAITFTFRPFSFLLPLNKMFVMCAAILCNRQYDSVGCPSQCSRGANNTKNYLTSTKSEIANRVGFKSESYSVVLPELVGSWPTANKYKNITVFGKDGKEYMLVRDEYIIWTGRDSLKTTPNSNDNKMNNNDATDEKLSGFNVLIIVNVAGFFVVVMLLLILIVLVTGINLK